MPSALGLRDIPKPRETFYSYVGRLAAINGVSLHDFLSDFGLSKRKFLDLDERVLSAIAQLADLNQADLAELVSWTGLPKGKVRMAYRGEQIVTRAVRNPTVRGCPSCLRQDTDGNLDTTAAMAMRGHWLLRHSRICLLHEQMLVPLWSADLLLERYDTQARLAEIFPSIMDGTMTGVSVSPTAFDHWLDRRLVTMTDTTPLGRHPVNDVATLCELVGQLIPHSKDGAAQEASTPDLHHACAAGFDCMIKGQRGLEDLLDRRLADRAPSDGPATVFGPLYQKLGDTLLYDQGFDHFRALLRERILETWPIAAGETVLG